MSVKDKMLKVLSETVEYYKTNPRAISKNGGGCSYYNAKGAKCALGRCMEDQYAKSLQDNGEWVQGLEKQLRDGRVDAEDRDLFEGLHTLDDILKEEYKGLPQSFWADLQQLHDNGSNWGEGFITGEGEDNVDEIRQRIEYENYN